MRVYLKRSIQKGGRAMKPTPSVLATFAPRKIPILCGHGNAEQCFIWCPIIFLLFALCGCGGVAETRASQTSALLPAEEPELTERSQKSSETEAGNARVCTTADISGGVREELILELQAAKARDDRNEQVRLNNYWSDRSPDTMEFDEQKRLVDSVVDALKMGETVECSLIKQALKVIPSC
jgi:hypothetical protein